MNTETRIRFDNAINAKIDQMTRDANQLIELAHCKPLNIDQQGALRWLQTMLTEQVKKMDSERNAA